MCCWVAPLLSRDKTLLKLWNIRWLDAQEGGYQIPWSPFEITMRWVYFFSVPKKGVFVNVKQYKVTLFLDAIALTPARHQGPCLSIRILFGVHQYFSSHHIIFPKSETASCLPIDCLPSTMLFVFFKHYVCTCFHQSSITIFNQKGCNVNNYYC